MKRLILIILLLVLTVGVVRAVDCGGDGECLKLQSEINELSREVSIRSEANEKNADEMRSLQARVKELQAQIGQAEKELDELGDDLLTREAAAVVQYKVLSVKTREFYKSLRGKSVLSFLFSSLEAGEISRNLAYRSQTQDQDRQIILQMSKEIIEIESDKVDLEKRKGYLSSLSSQLDKDAKFLEGEVAGVSEYIGSLEGKIVALSAKQQSIIGQRLASLNLPTSLGAGLFCTDDRNLNPGFSPAFAFYTFGIPHRVGMNQYGAYGRATFGGQDYRTILQAYFDNTSIECRDMPSQITVSGYRSMGMDEYVKGVVNKEMGANIPEALKAQAIAARSYALATTNNASSSICATQSCQVYSDARRGEANSAVDVTGKDVCGEGKAEVLVSGGQIIKAWFASTSGGYTFNSGDVWSSATNYTKRMRDTQGDISSFSDLLSKAYDRESPCFYSAQGWRNEYGKSAWLKPSEVADIVNVLMLAEADSSSVDHLYQTDKPHPYGGEVWNEEKIRQELRNKNITPFNNVSSVSIGADFNTGRTTNVSISGDGGSRSFSGDEFRNYLNLRAPANIQIVGPLFNIEVK